MTAEARKNLDTADMRGLDFREDVLQKLVQIFRVIQGNCNLQLTEKVTPGMFII